MYVEVPLDVDFVVSIATYTISFATFMPLLVIYRNETFLPLAFYRLLAILQPAAFLCFTLVE
jgi:hypothetical protein